jgi:hypothetical protein
MPNSGINPSVLGSCRTPKIPLPFPFMIVVVNGDDNEQSRNLRRAALGCQAVLMMTKHGLLQLQYPRPPSQSKLLVSMDDGSKNGQKIQPFETGYGSILAARKIPGKTVDGSGRRSGDGRTKSASVAAGLAGGKVGTGPARPGRSAAVCRGDGAAGAPYQAIRSNSQLRW